MDQGCNIKVFILGRMNIPEGEGRSIPGMIECDRDVEAILGRFLCPPGNSCDRITEC